jgi:hypothetical protein
MAYISQRSGAEELRQQNEEMRREYPWAFRQIQAAKESYSIQQALTAAREHPSMDAAYARRSTPTSRRSIRS